jgi:hypothetical protein
MALSLRATQSLFTRLVARLIDEATLRGYDLTFGETYRSAEDAARLAARGLGIADSLHTRRLAIDLNLFRAGVYLTATEDYRPLGEWWEAQSGPDYQCAWGGHFGDGDHFSIAYEGHE